jgi:AcrR family transcriptional regulator
MQLRKDTLIRQKEIVLAARKLIVKYGSENVTIKKMAHEIGVTEGAIYRHFNSKKDILSFLIDDIEETLIGDIAKNYSGKVGSISSLAKILMEHITSIEQRRGVTFQVIAEIISFGDEQLNTKVYNVINNYVAHIKDILSEGIKSGIISPDIDVDAVAKLYFGMTQGLVNIWALSKYSFNLEKEYKPLWEVFIKSIKNPENNGE